jgi:hypothetical protein
MYYFTIKSANGCWMAGRRVLKKQMIQPVNLQLNFLAFLLKEKFKHKANKEK